MRYIKGFDALRAVSILFVILSHLGILYYLPDTVFFKTRFYSLISGSSGVNIFFTLSGFLITSILLSEKRKNNKINFLNFYARRFLRLLPPLILFYLTVGILMEYEMIQASKIGFFYSVFYLYNFVPDVYYTGELGHTWSLALEEQFYIVWPIVVSFFSRKKMVVIIAATVLMCILAAYSFPCIEAIQNFKYTRWFIPAIAPVLIGCFFAILNEKNKMSWNVLLLKNSKVIIIAFLLYMFPLYAPSFALKLNLIFQSIAIGLILIWVFYNQSSKIVGFMDYGLLSYIGKISYGLYVYQGFFLRTGPSGKLDIQQFPLNIILTIIVAIISYHFLEKPILKFKSRFR